MRKALLIVPAVLTLSGCPSSEKSGDTALAENRPAVDEAPEAPPARPLQASEQLQGALAAGAVVGAVVKKEPEREKAVMLAGQKVEAPEGFGLTLVQNPPLEKLSAVSDQARCDFGILLNHDTPEERAKLLEAMKNQYPGKQKAYTREVRGLKLEGVQVKSNDQDIRVFSAPVGRDLLAVSYAGAPGETDKCDPLLARLLDVLSRAK